MLGVVFVHGIRSSHKTWDAFAELIAGDDDLAGVTAEVSPRFEYPSGIWLPSRWRPWRFQKLPSIETAADKLKVHLTTFAAEYDRLVLIGHSQGGLLIQRYLVRMLREGRGLELSRIHRVVQLATPNSGSELFRSVRRIAVRSPQEKELRAYNEVVFDALNEVLRKIVNAPAAPTEHTCRIPFSVYAGESDGIVTRASAQSQFPDSGVLPGDHFSIIKPASRSDLCYAAVKRLLLEAAHRPAPKSSVADVAQSSPDPPGPSHVMNIVGDVSRSVLVNGNDVTVEAPAGTAWLDAEAYFRRTARSDRYTHRWRLVGRDVQLQELHSFMSGEHGQLGLLVGRGGLGKTKLLHAAWQQLSNEDGAQVRFLDVEAPFGQRALADLPVGEVVVVIDDAHKEQIRIASVINAVHETNERARMLLALRPHGQLAVRSQLRDAGMAFDDAYRIDLVDLEIADAEALGREALGDEHAHFAPRLAHAGYDCPLLIVVGAALIRNKELDPDRFESHDELKLELTNAYAAVIGADAAAYSATRLAVLNAVAALQPVRIGDASFQTTLSKLTREPFHLVQRELDALEDNGVLLARGVSYRVVPDLLGDMLFAQAAYGKKRINPTGYIEEALAASDGDALQNLITNAGRIDWQERSPLPSHLLDGLWGVVQEHFRASDANGRVVMLNALARVSFFQPKPCLDLVNWAIQNPVVSSREASQDSRDDQSAIADAACLVLRGVALDPDYFPPAADLLWQLANDDARDPARFSSHPLAILGELASYNRSAPGPTRYQELLVTAVERWLGQGRPASRDPLAILAPLLSAEGEEQTFRPDAVVLSGYLIDPLFPPTATLRARVLTLAFDQLQSPDSHRIAAALDMVGAALFGPVGRFGQIPSEVRARWDGPYIDTLSRLRTVLGQLVLPAALYVTVRRKLQWLSEFGSDPVREACRAVFAAIPPDPRNDLARALHGGPIDPPADSTVELNHTYRDQAQQALFASVGAKLHHLNDTQAAALIEEAIDELHVIVGDEIAQARAFVWYLVKARPGLGQALLARIVPSPDSQLAGQSANILLAMVDTVGDAAIAHANDLLSTGSPRLAREVALVFGLQRGQREQLMDGEESLLRALIGHEDARTYQLAFGAIHFLAHIHPQLAAQLLTCVPPDDERFAWEEFAMLVGPHGTVPWNALPESFRQQVFRALRQRSSLEGYALGELLTLLSHDEPRPVLDLLLDRAKSLNNETASSGFSALPDRSVSTYRFRELADFQDYLRTVRDWLISTPASGWRTYIGPHLFSTVAGAYDAKVLQVIEECFDEPSSEKMNAAALMLRNAPKDVLANLRFVSRCLHAAQQAGQDSLSNIRGALHAVAFTGNRFGMNWTHTSDTGEQRSAAAELADRCPAGSIEQQFYQSILEAADRWNTYLSSTDDQQPDSREW